MVAKYGANFDNGVASVNSSLKDAGVNVEIAVSSADVAALLKSATKVTIGAAAGTYTAELEITDAEKAEVEKYVEEQVAEKLPEKTVVSVDTVKTVTVSGAADGVAAFDVTRDVTVVLKDKDTTTTTTTTTGDSGTTTTDVSGTTTETLPTGVSSVEVKTVDAETAENIYLSDEESFNVAGLIESVTLHLENGEDVTVDPATAIDFEMTPAEAYETVTEKTAGKVYFDGEVGLKYKGEEEVELTDTVKVAVALKGDTTLDGKVDATDLFETAYYVALQGAGKAPIFDTVKNGTALESKLAYLASDIDTESKAGENTEDGKLDATDMLYTAVYQAYNGAGNHIDWAEAIKMANGGK